MGAAGKAVSKAVNGAQDREAAAVSWRQLVGGVAVKQALFKCRRFRGHLKLLFFCFFLPQTLWSKKEPWRCHTQKKSGKTLFGHNYVGEQQKKNPTLVSTKRLWRLLKTWYTKHWKCLTVQLYSASFSFARSHELAKIFALLCFDLSARYDNSRFLHRSRLTEQKTHFLLAAPAAALALGRIRVIPMLDHFYWLRLHLQCKGKLSKPQTILLCLRSCYHFTIHQSHSCRRRADNGLLQLWWCVIIIHLGMWSTAQLMPCKWKFAIVFCKAAGADWHSLAYPAVHLHSWHVQGATKLPAPKLSVGCKENVRFVQCSYRCSAKSTCAKCSAVVGALQRVRALSAVRTQVQSVKCWKKAPITRVCDRKKTFKFCSHGDLIGTNVLSPKIGSPTTITESHVCFLLALSVP